MIHAPLIAELFRAVQASASSPIWSQGVTYTRGGTNFVCSKQNEAECIIHLRTPGQPMSPKVTLWPRELDWDCDCGNSESPCPHVAASVIMLKRGQLQMPGSPDTPSSDAAPAAAIAQLHYIFRPRHDGLHLERHIVGQGFPKKLDTTLISYKAGVETKRIQGPDVMATKADFAVDQVLKNYQGGPLERQRLEFLFKTIESDQKIFLSDKPIQISSSRILAQYECVDEANGYRLRRVKNSLVTQVFRHGVALCGDTLRLMNSTLLTPEEQKLVEDMGSYWGPEREKVLFADIIPKLQKKISITVSSLKRPHTLDLMPTLDLRLERDKDFLSGETTLSVLASIVYGDPPIAQLNYQTLELVPVQDYRSKRVSHLVTRNQEEERRIMQKLSRELDLQPGRRIILSGADAIAFVKRARGWEYTGDGAELFKVEERILQPKINVTEGEFYAMDMQFFPSGDGSGPSASFDSVFKAWEQGADNVPLLDGSWAKIPKDWLTRYGLRIREFLSLREALNEVPPLRLPELTALCDDLGQSYPESLDKLRGLLDNFESIGDATLPSDLRADLRPYQKKGVNWLSFLRDAGLGALLADDMGLGKTLQTLCVLQGKTLIVAPTSVLYNWAAEIQKFRPGLKSSVFYGDRRELDTTSDVVLTSYGVLRLDQERLRETQWDTIVIDEAQTIKNPDSQIAKAAHSLRGNFRVALSGTPVENRLDDLWSQFQFVNPGLLGRREEFLEKFARPIGQGDIETASRLKTRIKPFILRRLKRDVAPELPARTETVLYCELAKEERETYDMILASTRKEVLATLEHGGSILKALEVILRLRQAACHRGLIPGQNADESSKLDLLMETLEESLAEGHKSLVFSQWTSFLDRIEGELEKRKIRFSRIDGSTQKRQGIVDEFQSPEGPPIMLISLKAGGVGLNLTAADHVFIMDPWWNPSVEDQAADRAHRIGQQNPVMIHRLVARETIEEKILVLQEAKRDLARAVLDEGGAALSLTRQDIMDLLA
ncbi:MAG: DEAD/DEAH box helicase [Bdellovibrionota bacterium]